jgi:hypothetical protein
VLDVEERLLDRKLFAITGIARAVSKHLKQKKNWIHFWLFLLEYLNCITTRRT